MSEKENRIVIVGGGIIGCSTAYFLTKLGQKNVTLVEAVEVAHAASGRAGGFLALDWCDSGKSGALARRSFKLHETLGSELAAECGYRKMQTLSIGLAERNCSDAKSKQRKCSKPEWVDGDVLSSDVIGTTKTTAQVHPKLLTKAFITNAVKNGANLVNKRVISGKIVDNVVKGVILEDNSCINADIVILCLGPWANQGLDWFGIRKKLVTGIRGHSITINVDGNSNIDNTALFLSSKGDPEVYPRPDGTVYVCGTAASEYVPLPDNPKDVIHDPSTCQQIKSLAGQVCQELHDADNFSPSACYLPHSEDGTPIIGQVPNRSGLFMAAGHSCWGILQGPATGEALAELISIGKSSYVDLSPFDPARFF